MSNEQNHDDLTRALEIGWKPQAIGPAKKASIGMLLERLITDNSIADVLAVLAIACGNKGQHYRTTFLDEQRATVCDGIAADIILSSGHASKAGI